ncbi:E3 ubiquitin-protein ligase Siah2-like [Salarias fasciatus]|uniref:E3 ubiquitin-protein ligase Siah2-like n=1 Tax=Salarias fasciatus TaxID=181472 RepID=UPI001176B90C|nr:E3 ubiquitin-protein ligase Siah2-like [Salarias fasciatus]
MLCPASCLPLLRELAQWRCLLGWHRHHGVASSGAAALTATAHHTQGSEFRDRPQRPVGRTEPLLGSQCSSACVPSQRHSETVESDVCESGPCSCPCPGASCQWHGTLEAVVPHLRHTHKSITTLQGEDVVFLASNIGVRGAVDWLMLQSCFSENFLLVLEKQQHLEGHQQFFAVVLLIGTREQADAFAYRLQLSGRHRRRLTWEAAPRSIHDGVAAAILDGDCLVFDSTVAQLFADDGNLGINVTISMC